MLQTQKYALATLWMVAFAALLSILFDEKAKLPARRVLWHENGLQDPSGGQFGWTPSPACGRGPG